MSHERDAFWQRLVFFAGEQPQKIALWGSGLKLDYGTLLAEVGLHRQLLRDSSAKVVALILDNGPAALIWDLAILFEGVSCITLPPFFSATQRQHCLEQSRADLVIAEPVYDVELQAVGYERSGQFWQRTFTTSGNMPPDTAKLTFTSGTTGTPKGVCLSAESILTVARELYEVSSPVKPDHHLTLLPLAILLENIGCYAALYAGATLSLVAPQVMGINGVSSVDTPRLLAYLTQRRPDSMILVPQLLLLLVMACEMRAFDASVLRFVAVGGARVSLELLLRAQAAGIPIHEGYGLSECASVVALNRPDAYRPGSVGKPLPHVQVQLAEDGEILIGGVPMLGYLGDTPPADYWWPTGDVGEFDDDGYLYLKGRKKHQFVTSFSRNVNPEWVEAELTQSGQIAQAFVYGEAMAHNHALLSPHHPATTDQQLEATVKRANLALPDYAQIHTWTRLEQPFSTANGLATANGRPCREAILKHYSHHFISSDKAEAIQS
ncbi:AMP-binding protein [Pseudomonas cichorii]|uniref:AMP-binding protein n=1 Tax=Pseudomonas cichorii TaxID=36746 RepID=UPI0018E63EB3|nr:AMP-binding protein [Pseudomonas cichorii]MBI6851226.1 AMP-binding protein [Pseudomonas cichorii]